MGPHTFMYITSNLAFSHTEIAVFLRAGLLVGSTVVDIPLSLVSGFHPCQALRPTQ